MSTKKKGKAITPFKDYESTLDGGGYEGRFTRITHIQLVCMNELSHTAFRLYIMMKDYARGEVKFSFPHRIYKNFMSKETFAKARDELIEKKYLQAFISNKNLRIENEYKFSGEWRNRPENRLAIKNEIENN